jgi:hypothetical protein
MSDTTAATTVKTSESHIALLGGRIVGVLALLALAVRFLTVPWDFGGCFFQVWMSMVGTAGFTALHSRLKAKQRILACSILAPGLAFCFFGSIYFAPQAFFPFFFMCAALGGALWLWSQSITGPAVLAGLILVAIGGCCFSSAKHMALLTRFRGLKGADLSEIRFVPIEEGKQSIVVNDSLALARIAASLRSTTPYSPNHEGTRNLWRVTFVLANKAPILCLVGMGNRSHPEMAWIQFGSEVYQNPELPRALTESAGIRDFGP